MNDCALLEVRDLFRQPTQNSGSGLEEGVGADRSVAARLSRAAQFKQAVRRVGLTMTQISARTGVRYGQKTPYFIPTTFHYRLKQGITPRLCQIVALSEITGYRFRDWMKICGFDLQLIFALQLRLTHERTAILTPDDAMAARTFAGSGSAKLVTTRYLFAKVGTRDAVLFPRLVPGSIVRVDRFYPTPGSAKGSVDQRIWLVEHAAGLTCCQVKWTDTEHVILLPNCPPLSPWPLRLAHDARVLGVVDAELRPRRAAPNRPMRSHAIRESVPNLAQECTRRSGLSRLLRSSRSRAGLTLRAAHQMTMRIANLLGNREYGIALGQLSDYEALNKLPRHVAKIISLAAIYGIHVLELLEAADIHIDESEKANLIPDNRATTDPTSQNLFWRMSA